MTAALRLADAPTTAVALSDGLNAANSGKRLARERAEVAFSGLLKILKSNSGTLSLTERTIRIPLLHAIVTAEIAEGKTPTGSFDDRHPQQFATILRRTVAWLQGGRSADEVVNEVIRMELAKLAIELPK